MELTGTLFVIAAPSGAGKTSMVHELIQHVPDLSVSISHTTRPKRKGEIEGTHYYFVDQPVFKKMLANNEFIEHAKVFGHFYGTSREWVESQLAKGQDVILEIDWQGAQQVKRIFVNCVSIFIIPPSKADLLARLRARAQDDADVINSRMALANREIVHYKDFDYLIVNDDFATALNDLEIVIRSQRLLRSAQEVRHEKLLSDLLT